MVIFNGLDFIIILLVEVCIVSSDFFWLLYNIILFKFSCVKYIKFWFIIRLFVSDFLL